MIPSSFLYFEINIIGIILLIVLIFNMNKKTIGYYSSEQRLFSLIIFLNILILAFDTGMWLTDGIAEAHIRLINIICTTLYYILNPVIGYIWVLYVEYKLNRNINKLKHISFIFIIPLIVCTIMSVISPITGWMFSVDIFGNYNRGPYIIAMFALSFFYLIYSIVITILNMKRDGSVYERINYLYMIFFPVIMIVVSVIQGMYFGLPIMWICSMIFIVVVYINMQNSEIYTDYLTGLYNRRVVDKYLRIKINNISENRIFFLLAIDIDDFKIINDTFGHAVGDEVLVESAKIMRLAASLNDDIIVRMGGDEFLIICERESQEDVDSVVNNINKLIYDFNKKNSLDYNISFSIGMYVYKKSDENDIEWILKQADDDMYCRKKEKKDKATRDEKS